MNSLTQAVPMTVSDQPYLIGLVAHIHAACAAVQLERINSALRHVDKKDLSEKEQTFTWMVSSQGVNWQHVLTLVVQEEETVGHLVVLHLVATRSRSKSRVRSSERRLRQVGAALNAMTDESLNVTVTCRLSWHYQADESELPIRLPFGLPTAPTSPLQAVRGIRITSDDGETWVVFDLSHSVPNTLHIGSGYEFEAPLDEHILDSIIEYGHSLITQVGFAHRGG